MEIFVPSDFCPTHVTIPASKSIAQRYILAAALSSEKVILHNIGQSEDVLNMLATAKNLGATINLQSDYVEIIPAQKIKSSTFNVGESGLGARLLVPILAAIGGKYWVTGNGTLLQRTISETELFLRTNKFDCTSQNGFLPIEFSGKLQGGKLVSDGSHGSQFISGLLMALPLCNEDSELIVTDLKSMPYINLTLETLKNFGIKIEHHNYQKFIITGQQKYLPVQKTFSIEADYSGAANWIVAGSISTKPIKISGLKKKSHQGDSIILKLVEETGAKIQWIDGDLIVEKNQTRSFNFDATNHPDLFPPLVVLAAAATGMSTIKGVSRLKNKESNRSEILQTEFKKLGLDISISDDKMIIIGNGKLTNGSLFSNNDHRIAMVGAIASILTTQGLTVSGAEAVSKSYPDFWKQAGLA